MERASGAVLGEGGSEVGLRRLFTLHKTITSYFVIRSANEGPVCTPSRRPFFPDANRADRRPRQMLKRPHGEAGHRYRARNCIGPSLRSGCQLYYLPSCIGKLCQRIQLVCGCARINRVPGYRHGFGYVVCSSRRHQCRRAVEQNNITVG